MAEPKVDLELAIEHGLSEDEYDWILRILGRTPTYTELGIFSVMWSEHCSYKNSIALLKTLPREGSALLTKAGEENAGAIDIGDGLAVVFKIESHNHPTAVEPYQAAATGVGGILRDIFTMGARPIACLNSLRFGHLDQPRARYLFNGAVKGIGDYGNSFGVPTVGGEVYFEDCYAGNPLVNAMAVGIVKTDGLISATAKGAGNPVYIVGSSTGRDGVHGATYASEGISEATESKRPSVQIGDPFMEKLLLEATLEIIREDLIVGVQDMGAAGITCCTTEMSARGKSGMDIDLTKVPVREDNMTPYEIMLSESQERMLVCVKKGNENSVQEIFKKWGLHAVQIGTVIDEDRLIVRNNGQVVADMPADILVLGGGAPIYKRETKCPSYLDELNKLDIQDIAVPNDLDDSMIKLIGSPCIADRSWIYHQYDQTVRTNTAVAPGSDAAVMRIRKTKKALALTTDCNGRYCYLNPRRGAEIAVSEAARNITASGGRPVAITNCLNFGNPYKPEMYWNFTEAVGGMGEACRVFETPVTGGNVSFYNEDQITNRAVFPTPVIGMLGIIDDIAHITTQHFKDDGDIILLIGETHEELGGSEYLKIVHGKICGDCPQLDLQHEKLVQDAVRNLITSGLLKSCHDLSEGGLAVGLAECCITDRENQIGCNVKLESDLRHDILLFAESQSRFIVTVTAKDVGRASKQLRDAGITFAQIGSVGGDRLKINSMIDCSLTDLSAAYFATLHDFMDRPIEV
ncbi:MAG: phosphoribosylformylglycinamidine synthase subunit PurL [candidate division Zixibacteria bacterium]|nr:phosphoribosylformylglycinamidine synthase subunit PurL [candidate division Zixibacteria bacterium]